MQSTPTQPAQPVQSQQSAQPAQPARGRASKPANASTVTPRTFAFAGGVPSRAVSGTQVAAAGHKPAVTVTVAPTSNVRQPIGAAKPCLGCNSFRASAASNAALVAARARQASQQAASVAVAASTSTLPLKSSVAPPPEVVAAVAVANAAVDAAEVAKKNERSITTLWNRLTRRNPAHASTSATAPVGTTPDVASAAVAPIITDTPTKPGTNATGALPPATTKTMRRKAVVVNPLDALTLRADQSAPITDDPKLQEAVVNEAYEFLGQQNRVEKKTLEAIVAGAVGKQKDGTQVTLLSAIEYAALFKAVEYQTNIQGNKLRWSLPLRKLVDTELLKAFANQAFHGYDNVPYLLRILVQFFAVDFLHLTMHANRISKDEKFDNWIKWQKQRSARRAEMVH